MSSVTAAGSSPLSSITSPIVSPIPFSAVIFPFSFGSSNSWVIEVTGPVMSGFQRDARHPRLPGQRVLPVGVERRARLRVDEVGDVRDLVLVELLDPALVDHQPEEALVVGEDDDVAVDRLPLRERALDLPEVLRVRVDVLEVVDLDPRLSRELVERGVLLRLLDVVDVQRPVREIEHVLDLVRAATTAAPPPQAASSPGSDRSVAPAAPR